jgi:hypothetical protein
VLPGSSTLTIETPLAFAKPGREIAGHLAMLLGGPEVGGIPPHPGKPDPERRDAKHNVEGLRNTLRAELRNMTRSWGKNAQPNLERWLRQQGWEESNIQDVLQSLRRYDRWVLDTDVERYGVPEKLASELRELLLQMGVTQP